MVDSVGSKKLVTRVPEYDSSLMRAVLAVKDGNAESGQQQRVFNFIINDLAETFGLVYFADSFDRTSFLAGKAFVGQVLMGMVNGEAINKKILEEEKLKHNLTKEK